MRGFDDHALWAPCFQDYFSCPQLTKADLKKSVNSIPGYISRCEYLFVLCPATWPKKLPFSDGFDMF